MPPRGEMAVFSYPIYPQSRRIRTLVSLEQFKEAFKSIFKSFSQLESFRQPNHQIALGTPFDDGEKMEKIFPQLLSSGPDLRLEQFRVVNGLQCRLCDLPLQLEKNCFYLPQLAQSLALFEQIDASDLLIWYIKSSSKVVSYKNIRWFFATPFFLNGRMRFACIKLSRKKKKKQITVLGGHTVLNKDDAVFVYVHP
jgi:hypothetical protein